MTVLIAYEAKLLRLTMSTKYILAHLWLITSFDVVKMLPNKQFCSLAKDWQKKYKPWGII